MPVCIAGFGDYIEGSAAFSCFLDSLRKSQLAHAHVQTQDLAQLQSALPLVSPIQELCYSQHIHKKFPRDALVSPVDVLRRVLGCRCCHFSFPIHASKVELARQSECKIVATTVVCSASQ